MAAKCKYRAPTGVFWSFCVQAYKNQHLPWTAPPALVQHPDLFPRVAPSPSHPNPSRRYLAGPAAAAALPSFPPRSSPAAELAATAALRPDPLLTAASTRARPLPVARVSAASNSGEPPSSHGRGRPPRPAHGRARRRLLRCGAGPTTSASLLHGQTSKGNSKPYQGRGLKSPHFKSMGAIHKNRTSWHCCWRRAT
ncbi:hypothetical protein VPH35_028024 [Triticum aestivum]